MKNFKNEDFLSIMAFVVLLFAILLVANVGPIVYAPIERYLNPDKTGKVNPESFQEIISTPEIESLPKKDEIEQMDTLPKEDNKSQEITEAKPLGEQNKVKANNQIDYKVSKVYYKIENYGFEGEPLATAQTEYDDSNVNRTFNLNRAAGQIKGIVLRPGEGFSFHQIVGNTGVPSNGYKVAGILVGGAPASGYGGGVCQVSSTLYNAVLKAELEVIERHPHSAKVPYITAGLKDAMVSYSSGNDFQFKNNKDYSILIEMAVNEGICYARLVKFNEIEQM